MARKKYSYDPACEKLARYFLTEDGRIAADDEDIRNLAQELQIAVEGFEPQHPLTEEEAREQRAAHGQFGVGA